LKPQLYTRGVVMPGFVMRQLGRALAPVAFKLFTFTDPTQRETSSWSFVTYNSFRIEAPPGKALWLLSVRFQREMWQRMFGTTPSEAQSHLLFDNGPAVAGTATRSESPVTFVTHSPLGFVIPPGQSVNVVIQYRNYPAGHTTYMRNVRVDILYVEVEL
jgi:hypothetical protein